MILIPSANFFFSSKYHFKYLSLFLARFWRKIMIRFILVEGFCFMYEKAKKVFNWALYGNLRKIERDKAFSLLKWAVYSLLPPWDSG
jgi:hypothetical protein